MTRIGLPAGHRPRCLGPELSSYADRTLPAAALQVWDRHLVACMSCRQAVDAERRMLSSLRSSAGPALPGDLRAMLLSVAYCTGDDSARLATAGPDRMPAAQLPVVDRSAPAQHRSAVRATVFAGLAAGASAAAAWSLAVSGSALTSPAPASPSSGTAVQRSGAATTFSATMVSRSLRPVQQQAEPMPASGPFVSVVRSHSAQSTP